MGYFVGIANISSDILIAKPAWYRDIAEI